MRRLGPNLRAVEEGAFMVSFRMAAFAAAMMAALSAHAREPFSKPDLMRWGATQTELETALQGKCGKSINARSIVPPFLENIQTRQMQIDCDGFMFFGKPRWVEFVIGDDSLEMVWIMTAKEEEVALLAAMTEAYGAPTMSSANYVAFTNNGAALRLDKPEVLFYAPDVAAGVEEEFK